VRAIGSIQTEENQEFTCDDMCWKLLVPRIWALQAREVCVRNLKGLWQDLRWYTKETNGPPSPDKWCDLVVRAYDARGYSSNTAEFRWNAQCPAAGEGECHYAMNPNCEPNSPPDTVLLFETKAGWNQHGGPELFTFDNHDPKGGCVLLNDGTVKFIRTKEELAQLRWKP
jgi:hypothetical protein